MQDFSIFQPSTVGSKHVAKYVHPSFFVTSQLSLIFSKINHLRLLCYLYIMYIMLCVLLIANMYQYCTLGLHLWLYYVLYICVYYLQNIFHIISGARVCFPYLCLKTSVDTCAIAMAAGPLTYLTKLSPMRTPTSVDLKWKHVLSSRALLIPQRLVSVGLSTWQLCNRDRNCTRANRRIWMQCLLVSKKKCNPKLQIEICQLKIGKHMLHPGNAQHGT